MRTARAGATLPSPSHVLAFGAMFERWPSFVEARASAELSSSGLAKGARVVWESVPADAR